MLQIEETNGRPRPIRVGLGARGELQFVYRVRLIEFPERHIRSSKPAFDVALGKGIMVAIPLAIVCWMVVVRLVFLWLM